MTVRGLSTIRLGGLPRVESRREALLGACVTAAVATLLLVLGPAPGDAPAHLYRTFLVQHGSLVWDNLWYAGQYPLASYSLLYYLPAAVVGNLPLVFASAVASTALFASITFREWGEAARWPSRAFGVLAAAPVFTGLFSYSLGFATMLGALRLLQARRVWAAIALAALTLGFSPLAFVFLVLILAAVAVSRRRVTRRTIAVGVSLAAIAVLEATVLHLFPSPGIYPFHLLNLVCVLGVSATGMLLARSAKASGPLTAFFVLWALGSIAVYLVPTPLGGNWTRLNAFVFPLMLLTAALAGFRPRGLAAVALAGALAYNLTPYAMLIPYRVDNRPAAVSFWRPAIGFLRYNLLPGHRVEVVPTAAHWEAYWIPRAGFALARGWYRQLDVVDNPALYRPGLGRRAYGRWLREWAVEYVLLPKTPLDPYGGTREAALVRSGAAGLVRVARTGAWTIYAVPNATSILDGPGPATVRHFGHSSITGTVGAPGRYLLRVHYSPYWKARDVACISRGPNQMTYLDFLSSGSFSLRVTSTPDGLFDAATAPYEHC